MIATKGSPKGARYRPEVALVRGPIAGEGQPGDGSVQALYGGIYAITLDVNNKIHLFKASTLWAEITPLQAFPNLPVGAQHVSLAFDSSARAVIAWEYNNQVFVSQYDGLTSSYVVRGGFNGVDPVLWCDAFVLQQTADSDVVLFYLSQDRRSVISRIQRSSYATAFNLIALTSAANLEGVIEQDNRYHLVLQANSETFVLRSAIYPYQRRDVISVVTFALPSTAELEPYVLIFDFTVTHLDQLLSAIFAIPSTAVLHDIVTEFHFSDSLSTAMFAPPATAELKSIVLPQAFATDVISSATFTPPSSGELKTIIIPITPVTDVISTATFTLPAMAVLEAI